MPGPCGGNDTDITNRRFLLAESFTVALEPNKLGHVIHILTQTPAHMVWIYLRYGCIAYEVGEKEREGMKLAEERKCQMAKYSSERVWLLIKLLLVVNCRTERLRSEGIFSHFDFCFYFNPSCGKPRTHTFFSESGCANTHTHTHKLQID